MGNIGILLISMSISSELRQAGWEAIRRRAGTQNRLDWQVWRALRNKDAPASAKKVSKSVMVSSVLCVEESQGSEAHGRLSGLLHPKIIP